MEVFDSTLGKNFFKSNPVFLDCLKSFQNVIFNQSGKPSAGSIKDFSEGPPLHHSLLYHI